MEKITELALHLLQTTQALYDRVQAGSLEPISDLQQQRARLVAELNEACLQDWPDAAKAESRRLLEQSRQMEKEIITSLTAKRDAIGREYDQLQRNQKARKAYGNFS